MRKRPYFLEAFLQDWKDGVPTETMAEKYGLTVGSVRSLASTHKAKRPAEYLNQVRKTRKK